MVHPAVQHRIELARTALEGLGVKTHPLGDDASERLAVLRARTGLRMPDCCVLLAAQDVRGALATFDGNLSAVAAGLGIPLAI